uniref:Transcriptional regulator, GntR family n=1 Tax=Caulobacter sp. (strain K31) TaxID=366602 RepID=B0T8M1_CAUSK
MGRDRDPFDRALIALRARLVRTGPLQGAPLLVTPLAAELGVSPTPVREALAWLAGEGVIARRAGGYAAQIHDRESLARLYALAGLLADAVLAEAPLPSDARARLVIPLGDPLAELSAEPASILDAVLARIQAQLAPFRVAEDAVLSDADRVAITTTVARMGTRDEARRALRAQVRRYYRRRQRHAGEILGRSLGLTSI